MTEPSLSGGPLDSSFEEPRTTTDMERNHETSTIVGWKNILRRESVGAHGQQRAVAHPAPTKREDAVEVWTREAA